MKIVINNNTNISNKYIRYIKWKTYKLSKKYQELIYCEVFINIEGSRKKKYLSVVKLGIPGNDIIISNKQESLNQLCRVSVKDMARYLRKWKNKKAQGQIIKNS